MKTALLFLALVFCFSYCQAQPPDSTKRWSIYNTPAYNAAVKADSGVSVDPIQSEPDPLLAASKAEAWYARPAPYVYDPRGRPDSLTYQHPLFIENTLLHQQNERLMGKESRFWGFILLLVAGALAQAAAR